MATAPDAAERDYFTDKSVLLDPYDFFEEIRARGPVVQLTNRDMLFVTGFKEAVEVLLNKADFSSMIAAPGPAAPLPFEVEGDDISAQVLAYEESIRERDLMINQDGDFHLAARSLLNPLLVPSRLKANELFMHKYADEMVRDLVAEGGCEVVNEVAVPYVTLVIADLLGVPAEDQKQFRDVIDQGPPPGNMDDAENTAQSGALQFMIGYFMRYLGERRANPQGDIMTELALAKYPDGTLPELVEPAKAAMFLFAAGQDTSAKLIGNAMRFLCENKGMQDRLRADPTLVPAFLEEMLRLEGSTKMTARLAVRNTKIGDIDVPAGKRVFIGLAAANRDPRRWDDPNAFELNRPRIKEHVAFGRGAHTCAGAPLARVEVRVLFERLLEQTSDISISEKHHGPPNNRNLNYEASYIIRGLENLHVVLTPR
ncbi:cytochrome P450 [Novosphingobium sp. G106]|uniref:cytochrome P450 n=1 Tax=Novosphingobium sp. G106 TaxID=2849500 RepID=UPI001C2DA764|nr:cytochrome P450 [Novosphingobium sp. G106]MBV1690185.1 cytochrome P450 [Novosphingobium sp. G106]